MNWNEAYTLVGPIKGLTSATHAAQVLLWPWQTSEKKMWQKNNIPRCTIAQLQTASERPLRYFRQTHTHTLAHTTQTQNVDVNINWSNKMTICFLSPLKFNQHAQVYREANFVSLTQSELNVNEMPAIFTNKVQMFASGDGERASGRWWVCLVCVCFLCMHQFDKLHVSKIWLKGTLKRRFDKMPKQSQSIQRTNQNHSKITDAHKCMTEIHRWVYDATTKQCTVPWYAWSI